MRSNKGDLTKYTVTVTDKNNNILTDEALANTVIEDNSFYYLLSVIDMRLQLNRTNHLPEKGIDGGIKQQA